jgi:hypothetical protein
VLIKLTLHPDERTLRQFGIAALVGFGVLARLIWVHSTQVGLGAVRVPLTVGLATLGAASVLLSVRWPRANLPLFRTMAVISYPVGAVVSYLVLGILFFLVFGPVALALRAVGRDPLQRAADRNALSYWSPSPKRRSKESYFKQF